MKLKDDEINSPTGKPYMFKLSLADLLRSTMFGTITAVINDITRMPLKMPGHTSIWWMGILLLGKGIVPKFGSGIIMGIVSGILAVVLGLGKEGVFVFLKYFAPGLLIDFLALFFLNKLDSLVVGGICGALMSLSKMIADIVVGTIINIPLLFLVAGLGFVSLSHLIYGAIGGVLAAILIKRLKPRLSNWE